MPQVAFCNRHYCSNEGCRCSHACRNNGLYWAQLAYLLFEVGKKILCQHGLQRAASNSISPPSVSRKKFTTSACVVGSVRACMRHMLNRQPLGACKEVVRLSACTHTSMLQQASASNMGSSRGARTHGPCTAAYAGAQARTSRRARSSSAPFSLSASSCAASSLSSAICFAIVRRAMWPPFGGCQNALRVLLSKDLVGDTEESHEPAHAVSAPV